MKEDQKEIGTKLAQDAKDEGEGAFERIFWRILTELGWALGSIFLALLVAALIMIATGSNPLLAYSALLEGALSAPDLIFSWATPLILTGLSVALAFKAGLFNIGAEGQLYIGSMVATILGIYLFFPIIIHPFICLAIGTLCGAFWGMIPGLLKAYRGTHEVVSTMMLSFVAILLTEFLVSGPLREPGTPFPQTMTILPSAVLPNVFGSPVLHAGIFISIIAAIFIYFFLGRTVSGYEMRAVGQNPTAAEAAGINSKKLIVLSLVMSGALSGLAGAAEILGQYRRFIIGWSGGIGFDGITVAVLGLNNPFGVIFAAVFFGFLRAGAVAMQTLAGVPVEMVNIIQGLVVLFVAAPKIIKWLAKENVSYAKWIVKEPKNAIPLFLTAIIVLIGAFIGFGIGFANIRSDLVFTAQMLGIGILALWSFIAILMKRRGGFITALITSIAWIILAFLTVVFPKGTLTIPLTILGLIGVLLSLISSFLVLKKRVLIGGVS
ncbi:MAG: ABC transporter permease [Candidatus Hodarchaeota archaeon]